MLVGGTFPSSESKRLARDCPSGRLLPSEGESLSPPYCRLADADSGRSATKDTSGNGGTTSGFFVSSDAGLNRRKRAISSKRSEHPRVERMTETWFRAVNTLIPRRAAIPLFRSPATRHLKTSFWVGVRRASLSGEMADPVGSTDRKLTRISGSIRPEFPISRNGVAEMFILYEQVVSPTRIGERICAGRASSNALKGDLGEPWRAMRSNRRPDSVPASIRPFSLIASNASSQEAKRWRKRAPSWTAD